MTRKLAGFGLAFALAELAAAYLPPLASLLTAALFISLFLFAAFTQRRAARFALPAVAGLLAGALRQSCWPGRCGRDADAREIHREEGKKACEKEKQHREEHAPILPDE